MKNTQTIKREHLRELYKISCNNWKEEIANLALLSSKDEIEVENGLINKAYDQADSSQRKVLDKYFKKISNNIQDKIKNLDDVYKHLGVDREDVIPYKKSKNKLQKAANAFVDINHISLALNEGWVANFKDPNQYKYYPWFERKSNGWFVIGTGVCFSRTFGGFGFFYKTREIALYAANTFLNVYVDCLPE